MQIYYCQYGFVLLGHTDVLSLFNMFRKNKKTLFTHGAKCTVVSNLADFKTRKCKTKTCMLVANVVLGTGYCCGKCQKKGKHGMRCTKMGWAQMKFNFKAITKRSAGANASARGALGVAQTAFGSDMKFLSKSSEGDGLSTTLASSVCTPKNKVALYFSASWCPPCKAFTPKLIQFYEENKERGLEIIFVSGDREKKSFDTYYAEMPWLAVPFDDAAAIVDRFRVQSFPSLLILGKAGDVARRNGRLLVMKNDTSWLYAAATKTE